MPFTKADEYSPFKLQLISFLKKFDPEDKINVSEILFLSCSILLKEYLIFSFSSLSTNLPAEEIKVESMHSF